MSRCPHMPESGCVCDNCTYDCPMCEIDRLTAENADLCKRLEEAENDPDWIRASNDLIRLHNEMLELKSQLSIAVEELKDIQRCGDAPFKSIKDKNPWAILDRIFDGVDDALSKLG